MMFSWRQYILSVIICLISCGMVSQMICETKGKELLHLISGAFLAVTILSPLTRIHVEDYFHMPEENWLRPDIYLSEGEKMASEKQIECIIDSCEAYILDKAKALGVKVTAQVSLDEGKIPVFAVIHSDPTEPEIQTELQNILTTDLGIPKENQKWIWNQESNSS